MRSITKMTKYAVILRTDLRTVVFRQDIVAMFVILTLNGNGQKFIFAHMIFLHLINKV